jgi:hypothetical protein
MVAKKSKITCPSDRPTLTTGSYHVDITLLIPSTLEGRGLGLGVKMTFYEFINHAKVLSPPWAKWDLGGVSTG